MSKKYKSKSKNSKYIAIGIGVVIAIVALAAYTIQKEDVIATETAPATAVVKGLSEGNIAPDFSLSDPQNGQITKQSFAGKPLFIFFTTTWCTPCQLGAQNLAKYDSEAGDNSFNVLIVFVDDKETNQQFIQWKEKFGREDWYVAKGLDMANTYQVKYLDTKYVFDKSGVIRWVDLKPLSYSTIDPVLGPLLDA